MSSRAPELTTPSPRGSLIAEQRSRWERAFSERPDRYGPHASAAALVAARDFRAVGARTVLELGAGQGRDTLFFAAEGFDVAALDFSVTAVRTIEAKTARARVGGRITTTLHDVRRDLPFAASSFDACYSHMLFCMALSERELVALAAEIRRVLRPGGVCVYTARTVRDPDFGAGMHHGEGIFELDGFAVHYFSPALVTRLAEGFDDLQAEPFEEGALPRRLVRVTKRKPLGHHQAVRLP
jgi:SAM-dependent methyltransferase